MWARRLNMQAAPPPSTKPMSPVATQSRTLACSMTSELPAPCTSSPPPLVALPLTTPSPRSVSWPPLLTVKARDWSSASMMVDPSPAPSRVTSVPLISSGVPPSG